MPYRPIVGGESETRGVSLRRLVGRLWVTAMAFAILVVSSTAHAATSDCAEVKMPPASDAALEPYLSAVPRDVVLVPVQYVALPQPYRPDGPVDAVPPPTQVLFTSLQLEVTRNGAVIPGQVTEVEAISASSFALVATWTPDGQFEPGEYTVRVLPGQFFPEPDQTPGIAGAHYCSVSFVPSSVPFTVPDESYQDWVDGVEFALRAPQGALTTTPTSCCEVVPEECDRNVPCSHCWDMSQVPQVYAEFMGRGFNYLEFQVSATDDALEGGIGEWHPGTAFTRVSNGSRIAIFRLALYGSYCAELSVRADGVPLRRLEACGSATEGALEPERALPMEACRTRVPVSSCAMPPDGATELSHLFVVQAETEEEARAGLAAAPYDPLLGCYAPPGTDGGSPRVGLSRPPDPPFDSGCGFVPRGGALGGWAAALMLVGIAFVSRRRP